MDMTKGCYLCAISVIHNMRSCIQREASHEEELGSNFQCGRLSMVVMDS